MKSIENDIFNFLEDLYESSNVEYVNGSIYVSDETSNSGYKITVEED